MTFKKNHTYLIAELGNIHLHDIDNCRQAISDTFNAGADLVKLQCINPLTAYWASKKQYDRYNQIAWRIDKWQDFLKEMNGAHDNKVFVSTFDQSYISQLNECVSYWKVAFRMRDLESMVAQMVWTDKPIFFSTNGKHYFKDNQRYFRTSDSNFIPLYCTPYDVRYDRLPPQVYKQLEKGLYKGVSINFGGEYALNLCKSISPLSAFIEIHTKGFFSKGPDSEWSITTQQLEQLRREIN